MRDGYGHVSISLDKGDGWFACGGKMVPITWEKGSADNQLRYFLEDGSALTLGRGKSYVCVIPSSRSVSVE